jgi:hypothetical protein
VRTAFVGVDAIGFASASTIRLALRIDRLYAISRGGFEEFSIQTAKT